MTTAVLLGLLQGVSEWLPVSSEGVVAVAYSLMEDKPLNEAVGFALWLHAGTMPAALIVLRREVAALVREAAALLAQRARPGASSLPSTRQPRPNILNSPSPLPLFLAVATALGMVIGLPLVLTLGELSGLVGASAMGTVGVLMLVTGALQLRRREAGDRDRTRLNIFDALLAGVAQGLSVLPGFSRSGLTVAALLGRGVEKREALALSFLMSIPVSAGGAVFAALGSGVTLSPETLAAAAAAFVAGMATIRAMLAFVQRVNMGVFVMLVGAAIAASAILDIARS